MPQIIRNYLSYERASWLQDVEQAGYKIYAGEVGSIVAYKDQYENVKGEWLDGDGGYLNLS